MSFALMMLGGMALDLAVGWPDGLYTRIGHPVTWLGKVISALERRLNRGGRRRRLWLGALTTLLTVALAAVPALAVQALLPEGLAGSLIGALLAWPLIAMRAMHEHVAAVAIPLAQGDLEAARHAVSMIVGRDPARLDEAGIARAATESLAENSSDGIVAPLFWGAVAGLPGIAAYKAVNTLDSMIGHRNDRFEAFGKVAARLDDVVNWIPARLTGLLFALASGPRLPAALRVMRRDAPKHRSPNAGWPEGAMAGALNIRLSGPRVYGTRIAEEPWLNAGAPDPTPRDLTRALRLYRRAMALCALALAALILFR
ncbi:adenosylcobinamide-phosphate synthase CbiB [Salipiger pacificus]|nr:adenosylcobinamide-phosphate synthase CbiB [Alloyangia pacifica]MCA0948294.1 adenosylcobinamide-phosphate synthase CbiB [Alloyangia pacifica]